MSPTGKVSTHPGKLLLRAMRPAQWTKNSVLFAAFVFGYGDRALEVTWREGLQVIPAFVLFCMVSSAIYLCNDVRDRKHDRQHPIKKYRPIAAGLLAPRRALLSAALLLLVALPLGVVLSPPFAMVLASYLLLQVLYSAVLKNVALLDVFVIASGFVLRAIAGAALLQIPISPWLLICTFLLALFLALCKRRQEKASIEAGAGARQRISLQKYDLLLTDQLIGIVAAATIVTYAIYTLWPETIQKFGSPHLAFSLPIVMFGLFRYLDLLYRENKGDRPENVLLTDPPMIGTILLYGIFVLTLFSLQK